MPQTCEVLSWPKDFMFRAAEGDIGDLEGEFHRLLLTLSGGSCGYEVDESGLSVCNSQNSVFSVASRSTDVADDSESPDASQSADRGTCDISTKRCASSDCDANVVLQSFGDSILATPRIPLRMETLDGDGLALLNPPNPPISYSGSRAIRPRRIGKGSIRAFADVPG